MDSHHGFTSQMRSQILTVFVFCSFSFLPLLVGAQDAGGVVQPQGSGLSLFVGPILPKNNPATDEILNSWGLRYMMERAPGHYIEMGLAFSNSENSKYRNLDVSLRGDIPIQDMVAFFLAGPDLTVYQSTYYGGFHLGGGLMAQLASNAFFRTEMRFNFHPGIALLFTFGFDFYF